MANSTIRMVSTFLMLMALLLPVAPAGAQALADDGVEVHAANVPGPVVRPGDPLPFPPASEPADCTTSQDGTARYFLTLQSTAGTDILNGTGRLVNLGAGAGGGDAPAGVGQARPRRPAQARRGVTPGPDPAG